MHAGLELVSGYVPVLYNIYCLVTVSVCLYNNILQ